MPALLHARPPTDPAEERRLRKLAAARHAPASWIQRLASLPEAGTALASPNSPGGSTATPRRSTSGCTASTPAASMGWLTCPAPVCPGASASTSAAVSSPWPARRRPAGCTRAARGCWRPTSPRRRRTGLWTPWPRPPRPRGSPSAAARSAGSCWPNGCAGGTRGRGRPAPIPISPQKGAGHRLLHQPAAGHDRGLRRRARPGDPSQLPARARLDPGRPPGQGTTGLRPRAGAGPGWTARCGSAMGRRSP